jgi:hypothetical protein
VLEARALRGGGEGGALAGEWVEVVRDAGHSIVAAGEEEVDVGRHAREREPLGGVPSPADLQEVREGGERERGTSKTVVSQATERSWP